MVGKTLGHYRIDAKLGEGGMGVVYRALDTRLDRAVAIKVLPAARVEDAERKRRFVQEAKSASALNHPNIVHIYGIDTDSGVDFIAMELVEGKTLDGLIGPRGLETGEILNYAAQIADALATAHAAGIVHRDIKPSNIMVSGKGLIKVLDFGLAKLTEQAGSDPEAATRTMQARTEEGALVGTVAYMSPEQAEGKKIDTRSDIFSFGALLYEMVTGRRAFPGDNRVSVLAAILHKEPAAISETERGRVAPELETLIARCLRKDPQRRVQHLDDVKLALEELKQESASGSRENRRTARARPLRRVAWVAGMAGLLAMAFSAWRTWRPQETTAPMRAIPLTSEPGTHLHPSFSPDGNHVAFAWNGPKQDNQDIYVQQIGAGRPLRVTDDPGDDSSPRWSPDGRSIAFLRGNLQRGQFELRIVPPLGGQERKLADIRLGTLMRGWELLSLAWCPDSKCVLVTDSTGERKPDALFVVSLESGEKTQLTHPEYPVIGDTHPALSPDGSWLVFRRSTAPFIGELYRLRLGTGPIASGEPSRLASAGPSANDAAWMPNSKEILYSSSGGLWRLAFQGASKPSRLPFVGDDGQMPAVSQLQPERPTRLAYVRSYADYNIWRVETSASGAAASAPQAAISSTRWEGWPRLSPDGRRVAFASTRSGENEIWAADPDGSNAVQLTFMDANPGHPVWSPDGHSVAFHAAHDGQGDVFLVPASGGKVRNVTAQAGNDVFPEFSKDGQWIYYSSNRAGGDPVIWKIPVTGGESIQLTRSIGQAMMKSPDGAHLYYVETMDKPSILRRLHVSGGPAVRVLEGVVGGNFTVVEGGVYYIGRASEEARLEYFDFGSARSRTVAHNLGPVGLGLTASRDGRVLLYARLDSSADDVMFVENFR